MTLNVKKLESKMRSHALVDARVEVEIGTDRLSKALEALKTLAEFEPVLAGHVKQTQLALDRMRKLTNLIINMERVSP